MTLHLLRLFLLACLGILVSTAHAPAGTLKIGGTGAAVEVFRQLAPAYQAETSHTLQAVPSLGTSGGLNALGDGVLSLAVAGRALRDKEKARGLMIVASWRTGFGLVTSRPGPDNLARADVAKLFGADRPLWPDGAPVLVHLRPADDSDNDVLAQHFPGMAEAIQQLRKRRDLSIAATDQDNADLAERTKGSLAGATMAQILAERRNLRFVAIDGVAPTFETYRSGAYPYGKVFHLVVPAEPSVEARAFLAFAGKPAARALLEKLALLPVTP